MKNAKEKNADEEVLKGHLELVCLYGWTLLTK